jgi:hypothetical protein
VTATQRFAISRLDYKDCILFVLKSRGGVAPLNDVLDAVHHMVADFLTPYDYERTNSPPHEPRWRNSARWARDALVRDGALLPAQLSGTGIWALSPSGRRTAPTEPPAGLGRPRPAGERGKHATTRPSVRGPSHPVAADQLDSLARTMREAGEAPHGRDANPAMGTVIATLESLLTVRQRPGEKKESASKAKRTNCTSSTGSPRRVRTSLSSLTSSSAAGALDTARLTEFIEERWCDAIKSWKGADTGGVRFAREIEAMAALPLLGSLLAYRQGWIPVVEATRLAVRAAHIALGYPRRLGGALGALLKDDLSDKRAQAIRQGILHHTLTAWVQALEEGGAPETMLLASSLRAWADEIRTVVGDPQGWPPRKEWAWLLSADPDLPAPSEREDEVLSLAAWLSQASASKSFRLPRGTLLWHRNVGWAVLRRTKEQGRSELFPFVVGGSMDYKVGPGLDWIDVDAAVRSSPDASALTSTVAFVRTLAWETHDALERDKIIAKPSLFGA